MAKGTWSGRPEGRRILTFALAPPEGHPFYEPRRLARVETHRQVFAWILGLSADAGLVKGRRIGVDATRLEAIAALGSIVRRDSGESYDEFLIGLAQN